MEAELETQLSASEKRNADLKNQNLRLQTENENLKLKLASLTGQTGDQIIDLQRQLNETQISNAKLTRCIRELEQSNDDLERAKRALHASLDDFEKKLNHQIEKNVLLENELGEKEQLEEIIQRLKDEARDLKQELLVQQQTPSSFKTSVDEIDVCDDKTELKQCGLSNLRPNNLYSPFTNSKSINENSTSKKMQTNSNLIENCKLNQTSNSTTNDLPNSLLSPSTRISVLNIVSDLLRKVGALESRLNQSNQCKTIANSSSTTATTTNQTQSPIKNGLNGHFN